MIIDLSDVKKGDELYSLIHGTVNVLSNKYGYIGLTIFNGNNSFVTNHMLDGRLSHTCCNQNNHPVLFHNYDEMTEYYKSL